MKIALVLEGSYPYVSGGVSSWVNQIITELSEHRFIIVSIMPSRSKLGPMQYTLPDNVIDVRTLFLEDYLEENPLAGPREPRFSAREAQEVERFFRFDPGLDWSVALSALSDPRKAGRFSAFFKSRYFWDVLHRRYETHFGREAFNPFFWTLRSMYMPLVHLMQQPLPEADVYHAVSTGYAGLIAMVAKERFGCRILLTEHGIYAREREEEILQAKWVTGIYKRFWIDLFYFLAGGVYRHADLVLSLFDRNRRIQLELGSAEDRTFVIPNGVDPSRFDRPLQPHEEFHVGAVLRVVPIKDVKTLIRAFRLLRNVVDTAVLSLVGPTEEDPEYDRECRNLVRHLDLEPDVRFLGRQDVTELMPGFDVMVLSSLSEGQPLVILEAFAMGLPFIATDVGACKELIEGSHGETGSGAGFVVKPVSPYALFDAMLSIYQEPELGVAMGVNGKRRVLRDYTQEKMIASYREVYKAVGR